MRKDLPAGRAHTNIIKRPLLLTFMVAIVSYLNNHLMTCSAKNEEQELCMRDCFEIAGCQVLIFPIIPSRYNFLLLFFS